MTPGIDPSNALKESIGTSATRSFALEQVKLTTDMVAHLRSVTEGIPPTQSARRYLRSMDGGGAMARHRQVVKIAVAVARRANLGSRWRLLRLPKWTTPTLAQEVSLEEWALQRGYEDWSLDQIRAFYEGEAGPLPNPTRKDRQLERLRRKRIELINELEHLAVPSPTPSDNVSIWFQPDVSRRLIDAGYATLGELQTAIAQGGIWWRDIYAFGPRKAHNLASHVFLLVGSATPLPWRVDRHARTLAAATREPLNAWIAARTNSPDTVRSYRKEIERFAVWAAVERGKDFSDIDHTDCVAYKHFIADVPKEWISRRKVRRYSEGWAPFFCQPSIQSQKYSLTVLSAFYDWMMRAGLIDKSPWILVNTRLPDVRPRPPTSRAFSEEAEQAMIDHANRLDPPARERILFIIEFGIATGLRASELLHATRGDMFQSLGAWWINVIGKGSRARIVPIPGKAMDALSAYFAVRGLTVEHAADETPLLTGLHEPPAKERHVPYSTMADYFKRFMAKALSESAEVHHLRAVMKKSSLHWLRHTHATRAKEAGVPIDVVQANLGHADPRTTAIYYQAQEKRRLAQMEKAFRRK